MLSKYIDFHFTQVDGNRAAALLLPADRLAFSCVIFHEGWGDMFVVAAVRLRDAKYAHAKRLPVRRAGWAWSFKW